MLDRLRRIGLFDDEVGLGKSLFDVADADRNVLGDVVGGVIVQCRRTGAHGLVGIEHRRQSVIDDLDRGDRARSNKRIFRRYGRNSLTDITHLVARHDRLVVDEDAEAVHARNVGAGDDAFDAAPSPPQPRCRSTQCAHGRAASAAPARAACRAWSCRRHIAARPDTLLGASMRRTALPMTASSVSVSINAVAGRRPFWTSRASSTASKIF